MTRANATTIAPTRGFVVGTSPPTRDAPHSYKYQESTAGGRLPSAEQRKDSLHDLGFGGLLEPLGELTAEDQEHCSRQIHAGMEQDR